MIPSILIKIISWSLAFCLLIPLYFFLRQAQMIFIPPPENPEIQNHIKQIPGAATIQLITEDKLTLKGWHIAPEKQPHTAPWIIYFGGNAEDNRYFIKKFPKIFPHLHLWSINYRGYGGNPGRPSAKKLQQDTLTLYDQLKERYHPTTIFVIGRSLGSAMATHLTAHRPVQGAILITPFDSLLNTAQSHYPWLPINLLLQHRFQSDQKAINIDTPALFLVAGKDRIVPPVRAQRLFDLWKSKKKQWQFYPNHHHNDVTHAPGFWSHVNHFIQKHSEL
ncbi:alpha/beta hydrolase [Magnetococcales bacterium HHB-1]